MPAALGSYYRTLSRKVLKAIGEGDWLYVVFAALFRCCYAIFPAKLYSSSSTGIKRKFYQWLVVLKPRSRLWHTERKHYLYYKNYRREPDYQGQGILDSAPQMCPKYSSGKDMATGIIFSSTIGSRLLVYLR